MAARAFWLGGALLLVAATYAARVDRVAGLYVDDAWYVLLAKAIASGDGFRLLNETYGYDVVGYTCDLGQGQDIEAIRQKALRTGAVEAIAEDVRNLFVDLFAFPSLIAGPEKRCPLRSQAMANGTLVALATARAALTHSSQLALGPGIATFACSNSVLLTNGALTVSCVGSP